MDLRPSYVSTVKFLREMLRRYKHTEAVADCPHCNLNYAATQLEKMAAEMINGKPTNQTLECPGQSCVSDKGSPMPPGI